MLQGEPCIYSGRKFEQYADNFLSLFKLVEYFTGDKYEKIFAIKNQFMPDSHPNFRLAPGSAHARPSTQPPIETSRIVSVHMFFFLFFFGGGVGQSVYSR